MIVKGLALLVLIVVGAQVLACAPEKSATLLPAPSAEEAADVAPKKTDLRLMYDLLDPDKITSAAEDILGSDDRSFIPVLVELLRFVPRGSYGGQVFAALDELSGQDFNGNWGLAVEWLGKQTDIAPPPGFTEWKGDLFGLIDNNFRDFIYPGVTSRIRVDEIVWGGVVKDGIPALNDPAFISADEATYLRGDERVFGVSINGDHRAYPFRIMDWHEMANDTVGGTKVALSYCTLCGAGILYATRVEGEEYVFGSSGLLYRSNKLMYDRQTNSLWNSLTGQPVVGALAQSGLVLKVLPLTITTWEQWRMEHPQTLVLDIDTGYQRDYTPGSAYGGYFASPDTMFPVWQRSGKLATKDWVLAAIIGDVAKAYPLDILSKETVSNDTLGGLNLVVVTSPATGSARAYVRGEHRFKPAPSSTDETAKALPRDVWGFPSDPSVANDPRRDNVLLDEEGEAWNVTEDWLVSQADPSQRLERLGAHMAYWFAWYAFHPDTHVYGQD